MSGPLSGYRIIEMGGIGPGPFAGMMLADSGAEVIRIDRPDTKFGPESTMLRSRKLVVLDLKDPADVDQLRALVKSADALYEGFRPGTMERLGLGPDILLADNPRLVYGRMTGWGQTGPLAPFAGHDLNYIALAGAAHSIGTAATPIPAPPFIGDMGGGGMLLAFAITSALLHAERTGQGQVIDCAMSEGAALLMTMIYGMYATQAWIPEREANLLDGGAPFYRAYRTADGKFISIAAIEPQFYAELIRRLGLDAETELSRQMDRVRWPVLRERFEEIFARKTQAEWCALLEQSDACFAPILDMSEAPLHPHNVMRQNFIELDGVHQPAPSPRYSVTGLDHPALPSQTTVAELLEERPT